MIKDFLRKIIYRIYLVGKFEDYRRSEYKKEIENNLKLTNAALISSTSNMAEATLHNRHNQNHIRIGEQSQIRGELEVSRHDSKIIIGDYSYVGPGTRIYCSKRITIGNRVLISHNVNIYDNNSHPLIASERHKDFLFIFENGYQNNDVDTKAKEIIIEDDVWIGFNCIILKGARIGKGAIIGAGTIVTGDVPAYAVVVGNPMRIINYTT